MKEDRITLTLCTFGVVTIEEVETPWEFSLKFDVPKGIHEAIHPILMEMGATFSSEEYLLYQFGDKENPNGSPDGTMASVLEKIAIFLPADSKDVLPNFQYKMTF